MRSTLYLDTARLGLMSIGAQRTQLDFVRLAGEEAGTLYFERFLKRGFDAWPEFLRKRYPALHRWRGVSYLKRGLKRLVDAAPDSQVLLANRSAELMRLAGSLLFGRCRNVLTTDLSWPNYERILRREARRTDCRVTRVPLRRLLLRERIDYREVADLLADAFVRHECDGLFLPAVNNLGVRLPLAEIVGAIRQRDELRFTVVDGAQAIAHLPPSLVGNCGDFFLAGCHKWLRAYHPLGLAFYGEPRSRASIEATLQVSLAKRRIDDPLLQMTRELEGGTLSRYGETVNLLPLFTCQGAVDDVFRNGANRFTPLQQRTVNAHRFFDLARGAGWKPVRPDDSLQTGICLLRARDKRRRLSPEQLRQNFHASGLAVTAYRHGLVRFSMPRTRWSDAEKQQLAAALGTCVSSVS